jgi:hypothetical protein
MRDDRERKVSHLIVQMLQIVTSVTAEAIKMVKKWNKYRFNGVARFKVVAELLQDTQIGIEMNIW